MNKTEETETWAYTIKPVSGWFDLHLSEIWHYRDLISLFVERDFISLYKQTILGPLWFVIQPVLTTLIFTIIFGHIANIPTDGVPAPLFYMAGVIAWNYFASCLNKTSDTFVSNAGMFGKVWFPRLTVPISIVINNMITFGIHFLVFLAFYLYFYAKGAAISPQPMILLLPLLILQMAALSLGFGIIVSSLTTRYRDLTQLVSFGVMLWMYVTPIVYPASAIPARFQWLIAFNPMAPIIEMFRHSFLGTGTIHPWQVGFSVATTMLILLIGMILFSRIEKSFMDTV